MFIDQESGYKLSLDDLIDKERESGLCCGPFERSLLLERAPERARRYLLKALEFPTIVNMPMSPFTGPGEGQPVGPPASFTSINTTNVETNLWTPAIWTPIPANTMYAGKLYKVSYGGIFSTSSVAPTSTWTPRAGQSSTPASNVTLGASTATTMIASLASVPFYGEFTLVIRALGLAASGATGTGNGFVVIGGITTAAGIVQSMGAAVPTTIDNTTASGLIVSQTWGTNAAANTLTCQWTLLRSLN
jgi:hypothetical protein